MSINHHRAGQLLSSYLDGELLPGDATAVQEHLLECAACRADFERLRATKGLLGELPVAEPPVEFWSSVREPVSHGLPLSARLPWPGPAPRRGVLWATAAAILVVLALALTPFIKGTVDRLHAAEIGVDLYVREHALGMSIEPLADRGFLGVVIGDADLALIGEPPRAGGSAP